MSHKQPVQVSNKGALSGYSPAVQRDPEVVPKAKRPTFSADEPPGHVYLPTIFRGRPAPLPAPPSAAFVYSGPANRPGWSWTHDQGRLLLQQETGSQTTYVENVPQGPDAQVVIRSLAQRGNKLIVTTSFGHMNPTLDVARDFPNQWFVHIGGYRVAANVSTVYGRMYQPMYLSGIVAGSMTSTNKIGYVASFPIPGVFRDISAFALGARLANPAAQVRVIWTNTFYDPATERDAATALLDAGADVLASSLESMATQQAAKERNKVSIGSTFDMAVYVGDTVLTSAVWNWGVKYVEIARRIAAGTYASESYWGGMADGIVNLAPMSARVPAAVVSRVQSERNQIVLGANPIFVGPIYDSYGNLCVSNGQAMTDAELLGMTWVVQGVVASGVDGCR